MKILRVGDPHVQVSNLKDSENLMEFVVQTAKKEKVDVVEFLGDLFHTHAVLRVEVVDFWRRAFEKMELESINCRVLVGNHDQPGSKEKEQEMNSLNIFARQLTSMGKQGGRRIIVSKPMSICGIAYIPYMSDHEAFLQAARILYKKGVTKTLVAHQTFTGAQYENGFFSEEGIDPALVPQEHIISGHIHKSQQVGKCFYPGTPKWDTMSDANQDKGVWIFEHDDIGNILDKKFISTRDIVTPISSFTIKEGEDVPDITSGRTYITLEGKSAWITKIKKKLLETEGVRIKVKPTDRISNTDRKNTFTLEEYLDKEFEPIETVSKEEIKNHLGNI